MSALLWVAVALVAGLLEILSLQFVLAMFAGGALAAALTALVGGQIPAQVLVFALASAVLLLVARPGLVRWSHRVPAAATNVAALVGRRAEVISEVTRRGGQVKLGGEIWSARTTTDVQHLPVGMDAYVVRIDGATAVVEAEPPPAPPPEARP